MDHRTCSWLFIGSQDIWALFMLWMYFSKYSSLKLGREEEEVEYSNVSYFAMLFSAGIGIDLFTYGVAESLWHYVGPNRYTGRHSNNQKAQDAINVTLFHWDIHGWISHVVIALLLGILAYRRGLPLTMRTCLYPLLGKRVYRKFGIIGNLTDIFCIVCTMFAVCTSLGLGTIQLNNILHRIDSNIPLNTKVRLGITGSITVLAIISVIIGVQHGIRRLSQICFGIGCLLMFIILFADNTWYILNLFCQSIGYYFQWIVQLGSHTDAFAQLGIAPDGKVFSEWFDGWTIFYRVFRISWSPFVGMFIAKISRGRTIKDFILYTLALPCFYSFFWFSLFGGVGIKMQNEAIKKGVTFNMYWQLIADTTKYDTRQEEIYALFGTTMLSCRSSKDMWFDVLDSYDGIGTFLSVLTIIAIILYFITSLDSASLVIVCISANGSLDPPFIQKMFWTFGAGMITAVIIGFEEESSFSAFYPLQTVSVICALSLTFLLNWACVAMYRAVREEYGEIGQNEKRWAYSMWDLNNCRRILKAAISVILPWYYLSQVRQKLNNSSTILYFIFTSLMYAIPFYLWVILMMTEVEVNNISYVGWGVLMFFFVFDGEMRGEVRTKYDIEGNIVEDFFAMMLVYPIAIMQMHEQVCYGSMRSKDVEVGIELQQPDGMDEDYVTEPNNGIHVVSYTPDNIY